MCVCVCVCIYRVTSERGVIHCTLTVVVLNENILSDIYIILPMLRLLSSKAQERKDF